MALSVKVRRLAHGRDLELPAASSAGSAGFDLRAALDKDRDLLLAPGERTEIPTGMVFEIPAGWEGQVRPRSGLAARYGLALVNSPGTIDSDYRGEIRVLIINLGREPVRICRGERIAQVVFAPVAEVHFEEVGDLSATDRGEGGFGSTGR
ncbi:MAG: dUTP diphosphatase [Thermoanaerobaculia bacterium]